METKTLLTLGPTVRNQFKTGEPDVLMVVMPEEAGKPEKPKPDDPADFLATCPDEPTVHTDPDILLPNFEE